jgi:hypothetical protein
MMLRLRNLKLVSAGPRKTFYHVIIFTLLAATALSNVLIYQHFRTSSLNMAYDAVYPTQPLRRPFVFRILSPKIIISISNVLGSVPVVQRLADQYLPNFLGKLTPLEKPIGLAYAIVLLIAFYIINVSLFLIFKKLTVASTLNIFVALQFFSHALAQFYSEHFYVYDVPTLAFSSLALVLLTYGRYTAYHFVLALGALNKETMSLFVIPTSVYLYFSAPKYWRAHILAQILVVILVRQFVLQYFDNPLPISQYNNHIRDYLRVNFESLAKSGYFTSLPVQVAIFTTIALFYGNFFKKPLLLRCFLFLPPIFFVAFMQGGLWGETRVFIEVSAILWISIWCNINNVIGIPIEGAEKASVQSSFDFLKEVLPSALVTFGNLYFVSIIILG